MYKKLIHCGTLSSLLYVAMNIFIPLNYEGYNSISQTVSELSAIDTPTRVVWVVFGTIYTLLIIAFGLGILKLSAGSSKLKILGILLFIYGLVSAFWPLAPMHQREILAQGGKSISDLLHLILASVTVLLMLLIMAYGASTFGKHFRIYTYITMATLLIFGLLTSLDAPKVEANLPTPLVGIWERINIGVFLIWIIVLEKTILKRQTSPY